MGCNKHKETVKPKPTSDDCLSNEVRNIIKAQNEMFNDGCASCDRSIQQLRGKETKLGPLNNTIPFILYCAGTCEPFIGSGVFKASEEDTDGKAFFGCVETPIFRAKQFVKNSDCCVKLELLLPVSDGCEVRSCDDVSKICPFFPEDDPITDFIATGICLTVNLRHFLGITCLDPICPIL
ncbi:hypothetical protein CFK37_02205 [Virgibacillus phasianinus]|uniref:Spore coat protein n=1 Tax=Virgibacillus phasianinus TaxID=2017483 RepID=A0A220TZ84_9BACI|nr:CotY/CotZ family spore coat protein [Virgibacillus phasianinus]ASK61092.1 hypothetical protein CFK37_02205 [Virgibacillus phasianinus]